MKDNMVIIRYSWHNVDNSKIYSINCPLHEALCKFQKAIELGAAYVSMSYFSSTDDSELNKLLLDS